MDNATTNSAHKKVGMAVDAECLKNPLLDKLNAMARELTGVDFLIVFPKEGQWGQVQLGNDRVVSPFCRLIMSSAEGSKHCRMCHILMSISACKEHVRDQRCHAGAHVFVSPLACGENDCFAVLSSCSFAQDLNADELAQEIKTRGEKLGLDPRALAEAYHQLPKLDSQQAALLRGIMEVTGEAVNEIRMRRAAVESLRKLRGPGTTAEHDMTVMIEAQLAGSAGTRENGEGAGTEDQQNRPRLLIELVADLVAKRPAMPFSVVSVSAAARMTPNYFSFLFREYQGQCFGDYVTEKRMELAEVLLSDLMLNIAEVAAKVGYEDPSYFSRRFKQRKGVSPREWRESRTA